MLSSTSVVALLVLAFVATAHAFYLPGVAPKEYTTGDKVELKVNKLTSFKTQLPYEYYKLPFCRPNPVVDAAENLGEVLTGNIIENSLYDLQFNVEDSCRVLCRKEYTPKQAMMFLDKIKEEYVVNWIVDNLPAASTIPLPDQERVVPIYHGFPLGGVIVSKGQETAHFLNNHMAITIKYHHPSPDTQTKLDGARIVGLSVEPFSINHKYVGEWNDASPPPLLSCKDRIEHVFSGDYPQLMDEKTPKQEVIWTYDVDYQPSMVRWASRWDVYLTTKHVNDDVHWFSIINSLLIVVFLTGMVAMIMMRTLHRDLNRYNRIPTEEEKAEDREETGWKLVHGDVFRAPNNPMLFSVMVGSGVQVLSMSFFSIVFSAIGFLSPANRGSLMSALLVLYVLMGVSAGYYASRTYKMFNGKEWQRCTLMTAFLIPGVVCAIIFVLNLAVWAEGSSGAIPFGSMVAVLALWFGISVPLTFMGAYFGYKRDVDKQPVGTQEIPRQIPEQPWYMHPLVTILVGGILPFGAVFVEVFFILSSIWMDQYYYVFGFLLLVFIILVITCGEITIVLCYFQLCGEDYRWWWRSFLTSGSSAVYLFLYSLFYFASKLKMDMFVSLVLYFGYMFTLSLLFFVATGVVGYLACLWFVYKIYAAVKVD